MSEVTMEKLVALCKNRGIVYPGSDIYGGLANAWGLRSAGRRSKTTSNRPGGKVCAPVAPITWGWTRHSDESRRYGWPRGM